MERIKALCRERGESLTGMLAGAGVSRNAFYSLARRPSIVPRTVSAVARRLRVEPGMLLVGGDEPVQAMRSLLAETDAIVKRHPAVDRDNVRHALLLLSEPPVNRLRRALVRSRRSAAH